MDERIKKYLPNYVQLYYVDYRDDLSDSIDLLQKCIEKNSLQPLGEAVYDWWDEDSSSYYMDEIREKMKHDGLEELFDETAFERRFLYKIKFENPTVEAKTAIWKSKLNWISEEKANQLAKEYDFSGGEIDNIVRKATMEEILNGSTITINRLKELCNTEKLISSNSEKKIGFYI